MQGRAYDAGSRFLGDDVDPEAITDDDDVRREDSLVAGDSSSVNCMHGSYTSSLSLHGVRVDDEHSGLDSSSRPSSPFDILTPQDVLPIEMARSRFLDLIVDHFVSDHVIEMVDCSGSDCSHLGDKSNKRKQQETIGLALEASGGLYRKLTQKFPKKGPCSFKRRELATSHSTRTKFPELVVQEEKRVRFVVINGLAIIERPDNMRMADAEWFKRLTGRSEVAICSRDYKFYSPRHKFRRSSQAAFDIPETSALAEDDNSPLACSSGFRPPNEIQNQHQSTSKRHIEHLENQTFLHLFHQAEDDSIQQAQHCTQFPPIHQCASAPPLSDNPQQQHQQQAYLSQHISCLQVGQSHLGGRMHIVPTSPAKFCDECGSPYLRATSKFCSECGTKRLGM